MPPKDPYAPIIPTLKSGGVGILPTDTLYGMVGSALNKEAVARIYALRKRDTKKPMIILISNANEVAHFGIVLNAATKKFLKKAWPGKVSIVLSLRPIRASLTKFSYLHRGTRSLAFRLPKTKILRELLKKTGPLVAPSANLQGKPPALTIEWAKRYFGDKVDFYVDIGKLAGEASTLATIRDGKPVILRAGAVKKF
jgi:L-threonylcarbamoyladenylate synthase